ncbi:MAG: hypothetical protein KDB23_11755 [Planctomycetales bacterium]|nr:hypothetical protein [Planctomycetales bacterium]
MRKMILMAMLVWSNLVCGGNRADADVIFAIDAIPGGDIDALRAVPVGTDFAVDVVATITGDNPPNTSLSSYFVSVVFDTNVLDLNPPGSSAAVVERLPAGFTFNLSPGVVVTENRFGDAERGEVSSLEAGTFGLGPVAGSSFVIGTINFSAVRAGSAILEPGFFNGIDGAFDNDGFDVVPIFRSAQISAVPEPSACALLGLLTPVVAGGCWRRSRRQFHQVLERAADRA